MSSTTDLATRRPGSVAQPGAALELRAGQTMWTKDQHAALVAMGIPRQASSAELGVFLHQCQRTGLDPFSKQIYLIYRDSYEDGRPVKKPTTQVGIDGFRVIRDRIAKRDGLRVEYEDTVWYSSDGQACEMWLWDEPPAACKFVVLVDGRRFPAKLRFAEYAQKKKGGELNKMWSEKPAHMIEKCAEADALRKAFPNDMAGVILEDAAPLAEDTPQAPQRPTAADIRARVHQPRQADPAAGEVVDAVVVDDDPGWPADATPARPAQPEQAAPPRDGDPRNAVLLHLGRLTVTTLPAQMEMTRRLLGWESIPPHLDAVAREPLAELIPVLAGISTPDELEAEATRREVTRGE